MPRALKVFQDASPLDDIQVASPCPAEWGDMVGSDTVRFCASCQKNVYNLSGMKRDEAVDLLRATEGRLCVRFFRRADGTVLTEDCPVGIAAVLRRAKRMTLGAAALSLGAVAAVLAMLGGTLTKKTCQRIDDARTTIEGVIEGHPQEMPLMGAPPPMPPPDMGQAVAVPEPVREIKGEATRPQPMMGKVSMPTPPRPHAQRPKTTAQPKAEPQKTMGTMVLGRK